MLKRPKINSGDKVYYSYWDQGDGATSNNQNITMWTTLGTGPNNEAKLDVYSYNILQKFDDKAFEPVDNNKGIPEKYLWSDNDDKNPPRVLYATKPDKKGWGSDIEMRNTREEQLVYFSSMSELKSKGYTVRSGPLRGKRYKSKTKQNLSNGINIAC
ncbi:hypothetical protein MGH68_01935 [Erysipelothrix sp. D19-032]